MNWFCLYSTIAGEFRALADLEARQFIAYLPLATRIRTARGQRQERQMPLLSRYLFICLGDANELCAVRSLATVQEVLPHENEPIAIPEHEIDRLKQREAAGEFRFENTATAKKRERVILRSLADLANLKLAV